MAGEVLRRGVEDDVRAVLERPLEGRRGERVVDHDERPPATLGCTPGHGRGDPVDVDDLEQGVGRRLEPDQPGALGQRFPEGVGPGREIDVVRRHARSSADPFEVPERPAVDVIADDDLVTRSRQLGDRRCRRRARREGDAVSPTLERRDRPFESFAGRVLRAGVLVASARSSHPLLGEGRRLEDRRRDGTGQFVGLGPGMDGQRVEARLAPVVGHATGTGGQPSSSNTSSSPSMSSICTPV